MGIISKYTLPIKLAAFALLICALLWVRGENAKLNGRLKASEIVNTYLTKANEQNERVIEGFSKQRLDNDAIAAAVAKRLDSNRARTEATRQGIRNASNDPKVRAWADSPVPGGVRDAIETRR